MATRVGTTDQLVDRKMDYPCIIYSNDREKRETCIFTSMETLIREARELLVLGEEDELHVVLEGDGARVRNEDVLLHMAQKSTYPLKLMILNNSRRETWLPMTVPSTLTSPSVQTINIQQSQNIQVGDSCKIVEGRYMSHASDASDGECMSNIDTGDAVSLDDISSIQKPIDRLYATIAQPKLWYELDRIARQVDYNEVLTYRDGNGLNVLHAAAFHNNVNAMVTIFRHFDWSELSTQAVDAARDTEHSELEGFTAMQIAEKKQNKSAENRIKKSDACENSSKSIHKTVRRRNITALKELCDQDPSIVNETDPDKFTPLHVAAGIGFLEGVKCLLKLGAKLNATTVEGETAICRASRMGYDDVVDYLIDLPNIDIDGRDSGGYTCLDYAARGNFRHIYGTLQRHGLPVTNNTLVCAAWGGHVNLVKEIAAMEGIDVNYQNKFGTTALHRASTEYHVDVVEYLLDKCAADPTILNADGKNAVHEAADYGHVNGLNTILSKRPTLVNTRGKLYQGGLVYIVRGKDRGRPAWYYVLVKRKLLAEFIRNLKSDTLELTDHGTLLNSGWGADPPKDMKQKMNDEYTKVKPSAPEDLTPLHYACLEQHPTVVERLLKLGAQVDARDAYGLTPLHLACMRGNETIVKLLLEAGADTKAKDDDGDTPRDVAKLNHQEATSAILDKTGITIFVKKHIFKQAKKLEELVEQDLNSDVTPEAFKDQIRDIIQELTTGAFTCLAELKTNEETIPKQLED